MNHVECTCNSTLPQTSTADRPKAVLKLIELKEVYLLLVPSPRHPGAYELRGLVQFTHPVAIIKDSNLAKLPELSLWRKPEAFNTENEQQLAPEAFRRSLEDLEPLYLNEVDGSKFSKLDCIVDEAVVEELTLV